MKPTPAPASSTLLMLAIGRDQRENGTLPVLDVWAVAQEGGVPLDQLEELLLNGATAGFLMQDEWGVVSLTDKGWRWYRRHGEDEQP